MNYTTISMSYAYISAKKQIEPAYITSNVF